MPFGKYRGEDLRDIPADYLDWLSSLDDLREPLWSALCDEMDRRQGNESPPPRSALSSCPAPTVAKELVAAGLRSLARTYHPDAGGTNAAMQDVNLVVEWLRSLIGERN